MRQKVVLHKKILHTVAQTIILTIILTLPVWGATDIKVTLDGEKLMFDVPPQIVNNRILLPLRSIFEVLGARVEWIDAERKIIAQRDSRMITAIIDDTRAFINGNEAVLDVPPTVIDNRTYVPARFVAESLGSGVRWDATARNMIITSNLPGLITRYNVMYNNLLKTVDEQKCFGYLDLSKDQAYSPETYLALEKELLGKYQPTKVDFDVYYGSRNGVAVYYFENGDKYIGDLVQGKKTGQGLYSWADGGYYVGEWLNDNRHGKGISSDGKGRYYGQWADDKKNGLGIILHQNGDKLLGTWKDDAINGVSAYYWAEGDKYVGEVDENCKINNKGVYFFANGEIRVGDIANNHFRRCKVTFPDGLSFFGEIDNEGNRVNADYYLTQEGKIMDVRQKCAEIINAVCTKDGNPQEKEKALHDYLIKNVRFDQENKNRNTIPDVSYTAYGALANGVAVCEGYAEAMNNLLNNAGFEAQIITGKAGTANEPAKWEGHAWNLVKIDGKTYHLDVTWDDPDQGGLVETDYFNVSDDFISKTHQWDTSKYPACTGKT